MSIVDEMFTRIVFDDIDSAIYKESYSAVKQIAQVMDETTPDCDEKTFAFRALYSALMHFGAALAKNDKYKSN